MKTHDIILIQEHWLSSDDLHNLSCLNSQFMYFASSAMDHKISQNMSVGRPFGGVGILYNQNRIKNINDVFKDSRSLIVAIGQIIIVNIYLPNCIIKEDYKLELQDIFANIENVIDNHADFEIIIAGDYNFQFKHSMLVFNFLTNLWVNSTLSHVIICYRLN